MVASNDMELRMSKRVTERVSVPRGHAPVRTGSEYPATVETTITLLRRGLGSLLIAGVVSHAGAQTSSQKASVQLSAVVQASPARITLAWTSLPSTTTITIYRKAIGATTWGSAIATPTAAALNFEDNTVAVGTAYEYRVVRVAAGVTGSGYISTGIAVPPVDYRGRMILLVDNTFSSTLSTELATLHDDLRMDGWSVVRVDLPRTSSLATVKSNVVAQYNADPVNTKALFIVGHLAVPYSGNINPDGHSEHLGAWPCDGYYGEMNGTWTDNSVNNNVAQRPANRNIPGDGKFDQSNFPSDVELQVGRVDFFDMPAFTVSETELLRSYLVKAHGFKKKFWTPTARGVVFDNLQWVSNPLAASAWRNIAPMVGAANITAANQYAAPFHQVVDEQSYLWTYSSGGGLVATEGSTITYNGADLVGTTQDFAGASSHWGVFNMLLGSNFGDWDNKNNFMRSTLGSGYALTNCWAGIPAWYFHHMGMGANIGYSTWTSMNNSSVYTPLTDGWQSTMGRVHLGLMGDPSLRQKMLVGPSSLVVTSVGGNASFTWSPSTETVDGYHLYAIDNSTGVITRITNAIVTGTSYTSSSPYVAGAEYMVRATRLIAEPSGSYYNLSLGSAAFATGVAAPDCAGVLGGTALPGTACNDGNACTINDTWNASCLCAGTSAIPSAVIIAGGATTFCNGGSVVLSTPTGTGYTYQWKRNGTNVSGATASTYTATIAGSYTVLVANSGCGVTSSAVAVAVASLPAASITAGGPTSFCSGGSVVLSTATGTGYAYQWKNNGTNISGATGATYTAAVAGNYTVMVTASGCSATSAFTAVSVSTAPTATITTGGATTFCSGNSVTLTANSGSGYTYQWRRNGTTITGATASAFSATLSGSYTVVVSNGGCSTTSSAISVTANAAPTAAIAAVGATAFCTGGNVVLNASAGTGYAYQWRRNGTNVSGATASSYTASTAGSYTVVVTANGCSVTSSATTVTVSSAPSASITAGGATSFCSGSSVVLTANNGTGYTYQWRRNGTAISGATTAAYTATLAGSYSVIVSNGGCSTTSTTTTVTVSTSPTASITAGGATSFCTGGNVLLSAVTGTGYTYQWRNAGLNITGATSSTYTASGSGSYSVLTSSGSCSSTSTAITVSVTTLPSATITAGGSTTICSGNSVTLTANSGAGITYQWRRNGTAITGATAGAFAATQAGSYSVVVSNGGCSTTSSATSVTVNASPTATHTAGGATSFCTGGSVLLSAGTGSGYTYQWRRNGINVSGATASTYSATTSGTYAVVVTSGGCSSTSTSTTVVVNSAPTAVITAGGTTSFCSGNSLLLTANSGAGYTYQWRRNGTAITGATSQSYSATQAGSYTVVVSNGGCSSTSGAVNATMTSGPSITCAANPANGTVTASVTSGSGPYSYSWNTSPVQTTATATVSSSGTYTVSVQGANGCASTCTVVMEMAAVPCTGFNLGAQGSWGANATAYNLSGYMVNGFATAFPSPNYLTIGCGTRLMRFTTGAAVIAALPTYGTPALLPSGITTNPTNLTNTLIGQVVAAKLNVRYDAIDPDFAPYEGLISELVITTGTFSGWTFQQLIDAADQTIGGCTNAYSLSVLSSTLTAINNGYDEPGEDVGYLDCPGTSGMILQNNPIEATTASPEISMLVYPVPVSGQATILLSEIREDGEATIDLLDIAGASQGVLFSGRVEAGVPKSVTWNADGLAPGAYLCRVIIGDRVLSQRVLVQ